MSSLLKAGYLEDKMKSVLSVLKLGLFGMLILVFGHGGAYACTCGELTVTQQRQNATAVFLGTVLGKKRSDAVERDGVHVTFKVERVWKGEVPQVTAVDSGATIDLYPFENLCAPPFKIGQRYIVFAFGSDNPTTDVCAGTRAAFYAKAAMKELGKSRRPFSAPKVGKD